MARAYCDWNATAPILPAAAEAVTRALTFGNPSSVHSEGREARAAMEVARSAVATLLGVPATGVTFTSGGTESAATLLQPASDESVLFVGAAEHACVLAGGGFGPDRIVVVGVDDAGRVTFPALSAAVAAKGTADHNVHVAVQIANNETGVINPPELFAAAHARGWHITADAVQAVGRMDLAPYWPFIGDAFISAHKLGGPKGVGATIAPSGTCRLSRPLIAGGGQEKGQRGGTENVAAIVGFGAAAAYASQAPLERVTRLRDEFEQRLLDLAPDAVIFGRAAPRLPNTSLFAIGGMRAETALIAFDLDGVAVSSGSACSSGKVGKSHVLAAMGVEQSLAAAAIRVSFGDRSSMDDVTKVVGSLERQIARLQSRRSAA